MRVILIHCKPGGHVTLETLGFGGESCRDASQPFVNVLGKVQRDDDSDDYFTPRTQPHDHIST